MTFNFYSAICIIASALIGAGIEYVIFYFTYKDKRAIDNLRKNFKECKKKLEEAETEKKEFEEQNKILKKEVENLLKQVEDLKGVVGDLSRHLYRIKKATGLTKELYNLLKDYDESLEEKVKKYLEKIDPLNKIEEETGKDEESSVKVF